MKIGILQCGHLMEEVANRHGNYSALYRRLLGEADFEYETWSVVDMEFPESVHDADGWLLSGSRHGAYEDLPFIKPLEAFIRTAYAEHVPLVGICFGHQIIAQALGGKVEQYKDGWAIGRQTYHFDDLGEVSLNAWHKDQIVRRPEGATVVASNDFCENAALVYDTRAFTVQAHPEFDNPVLADLVLHRKGHPGFPDEVMRRAEAEISKPVGGNTLARRIAEFFRQPREARNG
jgi:GMP synthase-like glutamine amidotransferase